MPETPDFEAIARAALDRWGRDDAPIQRALIVEDIAAQLRLIWNARGAADVTKLEAELSALMGVTASGPYVKNLDRAIRALDR